MEVLKFELIGSPPFRPFLVRDAPTDPSSSKMLSRSTGATLGEVEGQLLWLLRLIWEDDQQLFFLRLPNIVDELQRLLDTEPRAKAMLTERVSDIISDLAIICEYLRQLENYHPWALTFEDTMVEKKGKIEKQYVDACQPRLQMDRAMKACSQSVVAQYGKPSENRFDYPVWRRRNKENAEAMRKSEAHLDSFWSYIDKTMAQKGGDLTGTALQNLLTSRILQRTPEWSDPKTSSGKQVAGGDKDVVKPLSEVYFELESRTSKTLSDTAARVLKEKVKTRGSGVPPPSSFTTTIPHTPADKSPAIIPLDPRALKVFRTLSFTPSPSATPGEIPWTDFLHGMKSVGFGAEKLYGSVWHFTPTAKLGFDRSIQFHEPHPSGRFAFQVARR